MMYKENGYKENGSRFKCYKYWENTKQTPYNYKEEGLLKHIMSKKIVESSNDILPYILMFVEQSLFYLMKYTDGLKHFKDFHWKNR